MSMQRWSGLGVFVCVLVLGQVVALAGPPTPADDTIYIVKDDETSPSNVDVAVAVARETFESARVVVIARDDAFADALASALLQREAPLLLVPPTGPLPAAVLAEIQELGVEEAIILGGDAAVRPVVAEELSAEGLTVSRIAGATRFHTAVEIARAAAPSADTVYVARAFGADPNDPSQAFADSIAAGGLSARTDYPVLLTDTQSLNAVTAEYIDSAPHIRRAIIIGGTAAVSATVESDLRVRGLDVERAAGPSRAATAIAIAKIGGDNDASSAARVVISQGSGDSAWAAGFALASHAARFDAPIVLAIGDALPEESRAFLQTGIGGIDDEPVLTCAVVPSLCEVARTAAQLPAAPLSVAGSGHCADTGETEVVIDFESPAGLAATVTHASDSSVPDPAVMEADEFSDGAFFRLKPAALGMLTLAACDALTDQPVASATVSMDFRLTCAGGRLVAGCADGFSFVLAPTAAVGQSGLPIGVALGEYPVVTDRDFVPLIAPDTIGIGFNVFNNLDSDGVGVGDSSNDLFVNAGAGDEPAAIPLAPLGFDLVTGLHAEPGAFQHVDFAVDIQPGGRLTVDLTDAAGGTTAAVDQTLASSVQPYSLRLVIGARSGAAGVIVDIDNLRWTVEPAS